MNRLLSEQKIKLNIDDVCFLEKPKGSILIGGIRKRLEKGMREIPVRDLITHIERGGSFTPAAMAGTKGASWQSQQIIVADIDNDKPAVDEDGNEIEGVKTPVDNPLSSEEALHRCKENGIEPTFIYHTFRNSEALEKSRIVCVLDKPVESADEGKELTNRLSELLEKEHDGALDYSMADAARLIFGSTKGSVFYTGDSLTSIDALRALPESERPTKAAMKTNLIKRESSEFIMPTNTGLEYMKLNKTANWFKGWSEKHNIPILRSVEQGDGTMIYAVECPWSSKHSEDTGERQSAVMISPTGIIGYNCMHSHCSDKHWRDYRRFYEGRSVDVSVSDKKLSDVPLVLPVSDVEESEAEWLIDDTIPAGQITIIGGEGGTGKGFLTCNILAGVTTGHPCLLDMQIERTGVNDYSEAPVRDPQTVLYLSGEDTFEITIRKRLRKAGADLSKIYTMNFTTQLDAGITTDSPALERVIDVYRPALLVLDPLESFIGESVRMGDRNSMRQTLKPLLKYGEKYGLTTLLIAHANKGKGVWGRKRLADSSDLWDHARSVFLTGWTPDKKRYISHEKSNYHERTKTIEFEIVDEAVSFSNYSDLTDREYVLANTWENQGKSSRADAKDFIIETLNQSDEPMPVRELDELAEAIGYSRATMKRAKSELKKDGKIKFTNKGYAKEKQFFVELVSHTSYSL